MRLIGGGQTLADQQETLDVLYLRAERRRRQREEAEQARVIRWLDFLTLGIVVWAALVVAFVLLASHYHFGGL